MKYEIYLSSAFKKSFKKLDTKNKEKTLKVLEKLANDEVLDEKYKDHKLLGSFKNFRECHINPDLLLIYEKKETILVLSALYLGSHSKLF
ncbi:type II toxin-antitoxin system YafQ family toxin [Campylobacter sp. MIT 12-8780]|uniref:type II toxin-antitoxin system YafQ family toxin n=1 Tax=unclassified Campylobacter TaxID=2593542 RepID=UPI00115E7BAE|nr:MULTISPECIES: type II toxin-antitoxin system YafQ family toxin [unclassified Campylobacter]NDJ26378.1 type II toxin-antitoxin system YafQ family toxin [Campylobacter sp. MIT 19-121]TQR42955.1 type II toxin-antitoxin system YafQ family toxin [Campylobacter sp. MIT 12-8780]